MDILTDLAKDLLTPTQQLIRYLDQDCVQAIDYDAKNRLRQTDNQNIYWGVDYGQWPADVVADYTRWKRQIVQLNFARRIVDGLAGSLLTQRLEADYYPVEGDPDEWRNILKDMRSSESELLDWATSRRQCVRDMLIYEGMEEIFISDEYKETGNIGFRRLMPGHVVLDPFWRTDRVHDCKRAWKIAYMTAKEMMTTYRNAEDMDLIRTQAISDKIKGFQYGPQPGISFGSQTDDRRGSQYKVVEAYEVRDIIEKYEIDTLTNQELPKTDDVALKMAWLQSVAPDRDPGDLPFQVQMRERKTRRLFVVAYCNQIGRGAMLENGEDEIQIGRIKQFPVSAARLNGEKSGIVDLIKDPQRMINYRQSLATYALQTQASGGMAVDTGVFMGDAKLQAEYIKRKADPSYVCELPAGATNKFPNWNTPLNKGAFPNDAVNELLRLMDILDRISFHPAASDARTEGQGESGILFAQKAKMAEIANYCLNETVKQHENDKAEAYFLQSKVTHGNNNVERDFLLSSNKSKITINKHVTLFDGTEKVMNEIAKVPRHRVIISESPQGETRKLTTMMIANDLLGKLRPDENPISRSILSSGLVQNVDVFNEEQKNELKQAAQMEKELAVSNVQTKIATNKGMVDQANAQTAQAAMAGQPPIPGAPMEGQPSEPLPPMQNQQPPRPQVNQTGPRMPQ